MYNEKGGFLLSVSWEGGLQNEKAACVADSRRVGGWICTTDACEHLAVWILQSAGAVVFCTDPKKILDSSQIWTGDSVKNQKILRPKIYMHTNHAHKTLTLILWPRQVPSWPSAIGVVVWACGHALRPHDTTGTMKNFRPADVRHAPKNKTIGHPAHQTRQTFANFRDTSAMIQTFAKTHFCIPKTFPVVAANAPDFRIVHFFFET